jgi:plasmid stabilization system protein ParE
MAEIIWTERASQWMQDIYNHIAEDNPVAAMRMVESIQKKAMLLSKFPELGYRYEGSDNQNLRILLYGHYRIAYLIKHDRTIEITGVFHAALDMERYLF